MENNTATKIEKSRFSLFIDGSDCGLVWGVDAKTIRAEIVAERTARGLDGKVSVRKAGTSLGKR